MNDANTGCWEQRGGRGERKEKKWGMREGEERRGREIEGKERI